MHYALCIIHYAFTKFNPAAKVLKTKEKKKENSIFFSVHYALFIMHYEL